MERSKRVLRKRGNVLHSPKACRPSRRFLLRMASQVNRHSHLQRCRQALCVEAIQILVNPLILTLLPIPDTDSSCLELHNLVLTCVSEMIKHVAPQSRCCQNMLSPWMLVSIQPIHLPVGSLLINLDVHEAEAEIEVAPRWYLQYDYPHHHFLSSLISDVMVLPLHPSHLALVLDLVNLAISSF